MLFNVLPSALFLAAVGLTSAALAGTPSSPVPEGSPAPPRFVLDLSSQIEFSDESPAGPGGDIYRNRAAVPLFVPLSEDWRVIGIFGGTYTDYETDPFGGDGLQTWKVGGLLTLDGDFSETWSGTFGVLGGASWEEGASFSDSWNGGGLALASYRFSPGLKVGLGGLYLTRINNDALFVPIMGLEWQVSPAFAVTLRGLDLKAELEVSPDWSVFLRGEFDPDGALLERRPGSAAESFSDQGIRAAGGVRWTPCPSFSLTMEGGFGFHEYTLRDDGGRELAKDRVDPAPFAGISARLSF